MRGRNLTVGGFGIWLYPTDTSFYLHPLLCLYSPFLFPLFSFRKLLALGGGCWSLTWWLPPLKSLNGVCDADSVFTILPITLLHNVILCSIILWVVIDFRCPPGLGGSSVNVGSIPWNLLHQASLLGKAIQDARKYGCKFEKQGESWRGRGHQLQCISSIIV